MLTVNELRLEFGARVLFDNLGFSIVPKERVAFAGKNGAGKSSLMKCLAGIIKPNGGTISKPKDLQVGYLPQEGIHVVGRTLLEETLGAFAEAYELESKIKELSLKLEKLEPSSQAYSDLLHEIGDLELKFEAHNPAKMRPRIESVLQGLGFQKKDLERDCSEFSGGWQMRIAMAKLFLQEPEVLLLDEPTNHLDIDSQRWMENYLENYLGAIALISHDRALLDKLTTRTIAFHNGRAEEYTGNFSSYEVQYAERKEIILKQYKAQQREIKKAKAFIERFRAKATKASQAQSRIKQLEKIDLIEIEEEDAEVNFSFPPPPLSNHSVVKLDNVGRSYGDLKVFEGLDLEITRGEKIAIVGPNGAGKTTFCKLITGEETPTSGEIEMGGRVLPSFFSQTHADELDLKKNILQTVEEAATREAASQARTLLGCFLFRGDDVFKEVGVLSGGERSRVALVRILVRPANLLILDEPTNHLDMQSQDVLQHALKNYEGTVLIVSHNRAFLDPLVDKTLEFRPNQTPRLFHGNLSYYLEKTSEDSPTENSLEKAAKAPPQKLNKKEQRRKEAEERKRRAQVIRPLEEKLAELETLIAELEQAQNTITKHLSNPEVASDAQKSQEATSAYQQLAVKLETAYSEWSQVSDNLEKATEEA